VSNSFGWMAAPQFVAAYAMGGVLFFLMTLLKTAKEAATSDAVDRQQL
jgi:hypothetical protein